MKYKILLKKTNEITENEWLIYVKEFNVVFKTKFSKDDFIRKYTIAPLGFSFHSLVYVNDILIGAQSYIVELLNYKAEVIRVACGCDTFIKEDYRKSFTLFYDICESPDTVLTEYNVKAYIANPLPKLLEYHEATQTGFHLIAHLSTYVLPLTFKVVHPKLGFLDLIYKPILQIVLMIRSQNKTSIHNDEKLFRPHEYYSPYDYRTSQGKVGDIKFSWLWTKKNKHIKIINDNFESKGDIFTVSKYLNRKYRKNAEAIVFITANKLALPFKLFHKREMFIGKLLSGDINKDDFFNINNWKFSRGLFD